MKLYLLLAAGIFQFLLAGAQKVIPPTDHFVIEGQVKKNITIALSDLGKYPLYKKDSIVITNHLKVPRSTLKNVQLVLVKDVLAAMEIDAPDVKALSEYYFVFLASDGYKVVFSWNELYNNDLGNKIFLIVGYNEKEGIGMPNRTALISLSDSATGRRYVKGLSKIIVKRTE